MSESFKPLFLNETGQAIAAELRNISEKIGGASGGGMVSITYADLKALRDNGQLVAGTSYRITDYECTTIQENTKSAGHRFDIIVVADDEKTLNENARAIQHKGDTYFDGCNLAAWQLKYCLDHDADRFTWSGKNAYFFVSEDWKYVRYPMGDVDGKFAWNFEGDDGEMDFYDIMFTTTEVPKNGDFAEQDGETYEIYGSTTTELPNNARGVVWFMRDEYENVCYYDFKNIQYKKEGVYVYTFGGTKDGSLKGGCYQNRLPYARSLLFNTFGDSCYSNTFGNGCYSNTFGDNCYSNTFGNDCYSNTFGNSFHSNTFGNDCYSNTFGNSFHSNSFGNGCRSNTFGNSYSDNTFGNNCFSNTFGDSCSDNSLGDNCYFNTFGNSCRFNTFGNGCYSNTFGDSCYSNTFGNDCHSNTFGNGTTINFCQAIALGDEVQFCKIYGTTATSVNRYLQNIRIAQGLKGTSNSNKLAIAVATNLTYETYVGKNTSGNLVIKNLLD